MKVQVGQVNQDIIYIGNDTRPQQILEDIVDHALEDTGSARRPIGDDQVFIVTLRSGKGRLLFSNITNMDQTVGVMVKCVCVHVCVCFVCMVSVIYAVIKPLC